MVADDAALGLPPAESTRDRARAVALRLAEPLRSDDESSLDGEPEEERDRRDEERREERRRRDERRRRRERRAREDHRSITDEFGAGDVAVATQSAGPDPGSLWTAVVVAVVIAGVATLAYYLLTAS